MLCGVIFCECSLKIGKERLPDAKSEIQAIVTETKRNAEELRKYVAQSRVLIAERSSHFDAHYREAYTRVLEAWSTASVVIAR